MQCLKISIITVTYNAGTTIERCIQSVMAQSYSQIEYIIIDGMSSDQTMDIVRRFVKNIDIVVSEPDGGIYDAMNKGIGLATGQVIGILNADDYFANDNIISEVATAFSNDLIDAVYGNLEYVSPNGAIHRKWESKPYTAGLFNWGWMPPHPTFYCRKNMFKDWGAYDLNYGTAADYELMLRFVHVNRLRVKFIPTTMVKMNLGGVSNKNLISRLKAWFCDFRAMRDHGIKRPLLAVLCKPLRKLNQYRS